MSILDRAPESLLQSIQSGRCVLFLGAGLGYNMQNAKGELCPIASALSQALCNNFNLGFETDDLAQSSEIVALRKGEGVLLDSLRKLLLEFNPDDHYMWIPTVRWKAIYTTNFDDALLTAYDRCPQAAQNIVPIYGTAGLTDFSPFTDVPAYYVHGCLRQPRLPLVITQSQYAKYTEKRRMIFHQMQLDHSRSTFLYIGYSNRDPNWRTVYSELASEFGGQNLPRSFRIDPYPDPIQSEILYSHGIQTVKCDLAGLKSAYSSYSQNQTSESEDGVPNSIPVVSVLSHPC